ncbi:MAG: hypothetical protein V3V33_10710 [Candidatus Lokiarchaeia archaeon]
MSCNTKLKTALRVLTCICPCKNKEIIKRFTYDLEAFKEIKKFRKSQEIEYKIVEEKKNSDKVYNLINTH